MTPIRLTQEQYKRSLSDKKFTHVWLYSKSDTTQRTHNNSIFLSRTIGMPFACLVMENEGCMCDEDLQKVFGKDVFYDGAVSPDDKQNMNVDIYYIKGLVKQ
jgi:hypothetical protein